MRSWRSDHRILKSTLVTPKMTCRLEIWQYGLALSQPLVIRPDCTISVREGLWLVALQGEQVIGFGEAAPLPGFSGESLESVVHWLRQANWGSGLIPYPPFPSLQWAFFCLKSRWMLEGAAHTSESKTAAYSNDNGFSVGDRSQPIKVKLKGDTQDVHRIETALSQANRVRLDPNRSWSRALAEKILASVELNRIDFLEEPCASLTDSVEVCRQYGVALALDESTRELSPDSEPVARLFDASLAPSPPVMVLKPMLLGDRLQAWMDLGARMSCRMLISSSYETVQGLSMLSALAHKMAPNEAHGLGTGHIFSGNLVWPPRPTPELKLIHRVNEVRL